MSRPFGHPRGGVAATALPTTSLFTQFDGNDVASHTPASGLWSPTAGLDTVALTTRNGVGDGDPFSYGTSQNGLSTIAVDGTHWLAPVTTSATTYADVTFLMAARYAAGTNLYNFQKTDTSAQLARASADQLSLTDGNGNRVNLDKTGIGTAAAFGIYGFTWSGALGRIVMLTTGAFAESVTNAYVAADVQAVGLRHANVTYGVATIEIGEMLLYTTADLGQALQAVQYLADRWGITS